MDVEGASRVSGVGVLRSGWCFVYLMCKFWAGDRTPMRAQSRGNVQIDCVAWHECNCVLTAAGILVSFTSTSLGEVWWR